MSRWRGVAMLVRDAVEHGSVAVERLQRDAAKPVFAVLEEIPAIDPAVKLIHAAHDLSLTATHGSIRVVNRLVGSLLEAVLPAEEAERPSD